MSEKREQYTMGYGPVSTGLMAARSAATHAAFFLPHLKPGMTVLDCGCGPGSITLGFAKIVAPGQVVGTEIEESQVEIARARAAEQGISNVRFDAADLYSLPFADELFDAVFISAVLANLREPLCGVEEAYRVLKPGGVIGLKDFDHSGDIFYPLDPGVQKFGELYVRMRRGNGHDPESGRKLGALLNEAGFSRIEFAAVYESFTGSRAASFANVSLGLLQESWAAIFVERGWATQADIKEITEGWKRFANAPGAIFAAAWCEATARKEI